MYSAKDLTHEISTIIDDCNARRISGIDGEWIVNQIMSSHADIEGADTDFHVCMARERVREAVRKHINRYKIKPQLQPDDQLVLPGFTHVQERYSIIQNNRIVLMRVQDMTHAEHMARVRELRRMGKGCYQHADELERYAEEMEDAA